MLLRGVGRKRRGAVLVESAVVFGVFLILILGFLDLGVGVFRYHLMAHAAREGARQAIVHGEFASTLGAWGPTAVAPIGGGDPHPLAVAIVRTLPGIDPASVTIEAEWLDGTNAPGSRVRVSVSAIYQPSVTFLFNAPVLLSASSTMTIAH